MYNCVRSRSVTSNRSNQKRWSLLLLGALSAVCSAAGTDVARPPDLQSREVAPTQAPAIASQAQALQSTSMWGPFQLPAADPERGRKLTLPSPELAAEQDAQRRIEEQGIVVEGYRDPDDRAIKPKSLEDRFAERLNAGAPELIAGHYYNGFYYDGKLFYGSDPISFLVLNVFRRPGS